MGQAGNGCPHKRLEHWRGTSADGTRIHTGICMTCKLRIGPLETWEEVRIAFGRKPIIKINWKKEYEELLVKYNELVPKK